MSRIKGTTAQAGPPRWRRAPEPDVNAHPHGDPHQPAQQGQYQDDPFAAPQAPAFGRSQSHFPHDAFRQLSPERHAAAPSRPSYPPNFERGAQSHNAGQSLNERLGQHHAAEAQHRNDGYGRPGPGPQGGWPQQGDPSAYDLAHYAPDRYARPRNAPMHDAYADQRPYSPQDAAAADGWNTGGWNGNPQEADHYADPALGGYHPGYGEPHHEGAEDQEYVYEDEAEVQGGRRGSRMYMVAGALVAAIAVGGGLAYGYKTLGGRSDGKTPIVRADPAPAKTRPTDPGGKDVAHTDKKFINRLADAGTAGTGEQRADATSDTDAAGGPRKVTTLVVNRDGSMAAPSPVVPLPQNSTSSIGGGSGVPGMLIEGINSGPVRPQLRGSAPIETQAPVQQQQAPVQQQAPQRPQIIARATPAPEEAQRPKKPVQREEQSETPARTAAATPAPVQPATGSNGYVPVLSSQKSRMDALKVFADLQQKYSDALQNGTPDVREVNLGEKGVWHRLMLGPPGSREAAKTVCTQLKAQGYSGCWVTAY